MDALPTTSAAPSHKSLLVTVVASLIIALCVWDIFRALYDLFVLSGSPVTDASAAPGGATPDTVSAAILGVPNRFLMYHPRVAATGALAWNIGALIVAIGLLRRRDWARRIFVAVLAIELVALIVVVVVISLMMASKGKELSSPGIFAFQGAVLFAIPLWLVSIFASARVRSEFGASGRAA